MSVNAVVVSALWREASAPGSVPELLLLRSELSAERGEATGLCAGMLANRVSPKCQSVAICQVQEWHLRDILIHIALTVSKDEHLFTFKNYLYFLACELSPHILGKFFSVLLLEVWVLFCRVSLYIREFGLILKSKLQTFPHFIICGVFFFGFPYGGLCHVEFLNFLNSLI